MKALIVDDSVFMKKRLISFLVEVGTEIIGDANNGREGVELYKSLKPEIVFLDINMPELSGRDALVQILDFDPEAKVVMCSTEGCEDIIAECIENGAIYYILKPFVSSNVLQSLQEINSLLD